jgi:hypothetical protein
MREEGSRCDPPSKGCLRRRTDNGNSCIKPSLIPWPLGELDILCCSNADYD